jgi:AraC-like DNA-binding protein
MRWANPAAREAFEVRARELLARLQLATSVTEKVRELVLEGISRDRVDMDTVARKLAMSTPTLRRRLQEEGAVYSVIVDTCRMQLATQYLSDPRRSASEVAFLLGFADATSFYRAFKRWTGVSPGAFRDRGAPTPVPARDRSGTELLGCERAGQDIEPHGYSARTFQRAR